MKFVGLVPIDNVGVFLDILPEILTMMFGVLVKYRAGIVDFSYKNKEKIEAMVVADKFAGDLQDMDRRNTQLTHVTQSVVLADKDGPVAASQHQNTGLDLVDG